jgi:ribosomal protein L32
MNLRSTPQKTTSSFTSIQTGLLQRKCNSCGQYKIAGGECANCQPKRGLQRKLTIGASNDPLELEADRIADRVLAAPTNATINPAPSRIQRFTRQTDDQSDLAPTSVDQVLASSGRPLETSL